MNPTELPCVPGPVASARQVRAVRPGELDGILGTLEARQRVFVAASGFTARAQEFVLLPGDEGVDAALLGIGDDRSPHAFGDLPWKLPPGDWEIAPGDFDTEMALLGFLLGGYRYRTFKAPPREPARLLLPEADGRAALHARAAYLVRDLVNTPANLLGPAELADAAAALGEQFGARVTRIAGEALTRDYPTVAFVGQGSARPPVVASLAWRGSAAADSAPLVSLCGKGVCFDTGGYDLKPSAGMLRMKKDMGGAATALGLARTIMEADLPIRLALRIGCVENSVSGTAMRPLDVIRTRRGHAVEIGNTDAEGRLVLCDLLAEACEEKPALLADFATLTGAARIALGPELPALFCNDEKIAAALLDAGGRVHDPMWRLPLWDGYDPWLDSAIADFSNVSTKGMAGAITAALYLRRFVAPGTRWAHLDLYAWNDSTRPGRPEGGEAQTIRAMFEAISHEIIAMDTETTT